MNTGVLSAKGVCKSYGDNQVLQDLDLDIQPGKIYGLIGRNGAGQNHPAVHPHRPEHHGQRRGDLQRQVRVGKPGRAQPHLLLPGAPAHPVYRPQQPEDQVLPEHRLYLLPQLGPGVRPAAAPGVQAQPQEENLPAVQGADVHGNHPAGSGQRSPISPFWTNRWPGWMW